jgi:glycosyltransferase involved in cell wall biosynthesis
MIWLVNIGEPLPIDGNRPFRMMAWKDFLQSKGYQVFFLTTDFEHQRKIWISEMPDGFIKLKSVISYKKNISIRRLLNHLIVAISFVRYTIQTPKKPSTIIVSYPTMLLCLAVVMYAKYNRIKVIVDIRDKWPDIFIPYKPLRFVLFPLYLIKSYIMKNSICIAISPDYYRWAVGANTVLEPYILPLSNSNQNFDVTRTLSYNKPLVLVFSGTLGLTYSLDSILELHDLLILEGINFRIDICGDGPERVKFERQFEERKFINYLGWINEEELREVLNRAHIGLMFYRPHSPQGWPNKLIEYLSNGLPIINTLKGETWDLIAEKKLGINIEVSDLKSGSVFLKNLLHDSSAYRNITENCKKCFENQFSVDEVQNKLLSIINE